MHKCLHFWHHSEHIKDCWQQIQEAYPHWTVWHVWFPSLTWQQEKREWNMTAEIRSTLLKGLTIKAQIFTSFRSVTLSNESNSQNWAQEKKKERDKETVFFLRLFFLAQTSDNNWYIPRTKHRGSFEDQIKVHILDSEDRGLENHRSLLSADVDLRPFFLSFMFWPRKPGNHSQLQSKLPTKNLCHHYSITQKAQHDTNQLF